MTTEPTLLYKGLLENGLTRYNRPGWELPKGKRPGKWMPKINDIKICSRGYHVTDIDHLREWISPAIYVVEVRGKNIYDNNKSVWEQARLIRRIDGWGMAEMVEWARKCAKRVEYLINRTYADNAANTNAYAANAANAAYAAANAADAANAAYAAYAAANAADAANAAANAYAYNNETHWQTDLLKEMLNIP